MALSSTTNRVRYTADGTDSQYAYPFRIRAATDLLVTVRNTSGTETTLTYLTDYTVSGVGEASGGNVTLVDSNQAWLDSDGDLTSGYVITIRRKRPLTQTQDIRNQGDYYPETHEDAFDHGVMIAQAQQTQIDSALRLKETDDHTADMTLPLEADRASKFLAFNSDGEPIASSGSADTSVPVSAYIETLLDDTTASNAQTTLGISTFAKTLLDDASASATRDTLGASSGVWPATVGGTGQSSFTVGDILYASSTTALSKLPIGSSAQRLIVSSGLPAWANRYMVIQTKTTTYTALATDDAVHGSTSGGAWTLTLPDATTCAGHVLYLRKTDTSTNLWTIDGNGSQTVLGQASVAMSGQNDCLTLVSDGTNYVGLRAEDYYRTVSCIINGHATTPTATSEVGAWVSSVSRTNLGYYGITIRTGIFSAAPTVTFTPVRNLDNDRYAVTAWHVSATTSTTIDMQTSYTDDAGGTTDARVTRDDSTNLAVVARGLR